MQPWVLTLAFTVEEPVSILKHMLYLIISGKSTVSRGVEEVLKLLC